MSEQNMSKKKSWISFRVKPEEYDKIHKLFRATTHRKLSEYARKVLLNKPVVMKYRNASIDEFLTAMVPFKNELNAIGKNLNQAVKKLHSIGHSDEGKIWLYLNSKMIEEIHEKMQEIKSKINQSYERWLQE
jgi:hypothetical protein